jgi:hypothetical protein
VVNVGRRAERAIIEVAPDDPRRAARFVADVHELVRDERAAVTAAGRVEVVHGHCADNGPNQRSESIVHDVLSK